MLSVAALKDLRHAMHSFQSKKLAMNLPVPKRLDQVLSDKSK